MAAKFDPTINLGHILTFVGFLLTGAAAYSTMSSRVALLEQAQHQQEQRDSNQDAIVREHMTEINAHLGKIDDHLDAMNTRAEQRYDQLQKRAP